MKPAEWKGKAVSYAILCDSTGDLTVEEQQRYGIAMIPLYVNIDGEDFAD